MTIQEIKIANTRPSFTDTDMPHRGTIEAFLWLASKACISRELTLINQGLDTMVKLDRDGTFGLLCTPEQGEQVRFVSAMLKSFGDTNVAKKERVQLDGASLAIRELRSKVAKNAQYDF